MNLYNLIYRICTGENLPETEVQIRRSSYHPSQAHPISPDPNIYTYRTKAGDHFFQFSYHDIGGKYEIDIDMMPPFNGRSKNAHTIHVLPSPRQALHKICIHSGKEPQSFSDAQEVSKVYAELISTYIKTGVTPDRQLAK